MKHRRDPYQSYKSELSKLLKGHNLYMMSKDIEVIYRIFNLLSENSETDKIEGIISTTEILKYGGDIKEEKIKIVYSDILDWWESIEI